VESGPPPRRAAEALSAALTEDVAVTSADEVDGGFHARHSARSRSYRYRIFRRRVPSPFEARRSLWWPRPLDEDALAQAAGLVAGEHDFRAFTPSQTQHEVFRRLVYAAAWTSAGDYLEFTITADSFLRHMVRTLVGTMLERSPEDIERLLAGGVRVDAGSTAPAWGLYLERVAY